MTDFNDALGIAYLPPPPAYPLEQPIAAGGAPASPGPAGAAARPDASPTPLSGTAPFGNGFRDALNLAQVIGRAPQGGMFGPNTGRVMSALGAGLSSAGQNFNKPGAAAFAAGAGAALQGGQSYDNQLQSLKLKALQTAIAAWKVGDIAAYHRSLADYHNTVAEEKRQRARPATPSKPPAPSAPADESAEAAAPAAPPVPADGAPAEVAAVEPHVMVAHGAALGRLLTHAGVPPDRVDPADLEGAARLMAAKAMPADAAFEVASLHNAIDAGHVSAPEVDLIYGPGAADAIRSTATS